MGREGHGPHLRLIHLGDANLAIGEFQKVAEVGFHVRNGQALREEDDRPSGALHGGGEGIIVAKGILPDVHHANFIEEWAANGGAPTPAEILGMIAEHGHYGSIPGSQQRGRQIILVGDEPAHGGSRADSGIGEWSRQALQPGFSGTSVGVSKNEDFKFRGQLLNRRAQIMDFLAAIHRLASDDHGCFYT